MIERLTNDVTKDIFHLGRCHYYQTNISLTAWLASRTWPPNIARAQRGVESQRGSQRGGQVLAIGGVPADSFQLLILSLLCTPGAPGRSLTSMRLGIYLSLLGTQRKRALA